MTERRADNITIDRDSLLRLALQTVTPSESVEDLIDAILHGEDSDIRREIQTLDILNSKLHFGAET